ncbi:putative bifunctional diguanylate cyclase/phosphodiesterase [Actinoplanes sp. NPDC051494]|uniref:putative bifunctional diguanylate cyclase/phosphodiesterase n=1 Tax=Actinoplanes sp. NPDC051494 TaxID=3363907 RepID=UPI0037B8D1E6
MLVVTEASVRRRRWFGLALVLLVLLSGAGGTALATIMVHRSESHNADRAMDDYTTLVCRAVLDEVQHYSDALADLAGGINAQNDMDRNAFTTITAGLSGVRLPGASYVAFMVPATTAEVPAVQRYWRARGADGLVLDPAAGVDEHSFVVFSRAFDGVPGRDGTDMTNAAEPMEALTSARQTGTMTVSKAYILLKDRSLPQAQQQMSFAITLPVYGKGLDGRKGDLRGWVVMGVHLTDFLHESIAEQTEQAVSVDLFEHVSGTDLSIVKVGVPDTTSSLVRQRTVFVSNREWRLTIRPTVGLLSASERRMDTIAAGGGALVTLLVTALVTVLVTARNRALTQVEHATAALRGDIRRRQEVERQLREREDELERLALHDPLTGLANRTALDVRLGTELRGDKRIGLLLIDLNGFKPINDVYGHDAGDLVLTEFSRLLLDSVRTEDVVARIGGDEFVVLLADVPDESHALTVAQRILTAAAGNPVRIGEDTLPIRASIGVTAVRPGDTAKELQRRADVAMYHAKRTGSHNLAVHDPSMIDRRSADAALGDDVSVALERGELHVVYQPIVDLDNGRPVAAETLLRWRHPRHGNVPPDRFIALAERNGSINAIGLWVLDQACRQAREWDVRYVSVNMSPRQLQEPTIVHDVLAVLRRTGLDPSKLVLEVTESVIVDETAGIPALRELRSYGIRIAIDDFGTGYSSLHYLTRMPVDILKIDRSFVNELNGTPEGAAVTEAVLRLSQALHLTTIAEGIETPAQAKELRELGCDTGQGYLYAPPRPAAELEGFATVLDGHPVRP